jgi:hypothetical protein
MGVKYNSSKLQAELLAAGIPIESCDSTGRIVYRPEATEQHRQQASQVLAAHDATPTRAQRLSDELGMSEDQVAFLLVAARGQNAAPWARARVQAMLQRIDALA